MTHRRFSRRRFLRAAAATLSLGSAPALLAQQAWPARSVRIVVPFPPGGPADISARVLSEAMSPQLGQPVVVENISGAGGITGMTAAARSTDRHTLAMASTSMTIMPALRTDLTFDLVKDFKPIGMVSAQPLVLVVPASSPLASLADVIREGRARPGTLTAGNSGIGTLSHLATELFNSMQGTAITPVPYRGENLLLPELLNGTVSMGLINLPITIPQLQAGKLRALAVAAPETLADLPDVKTFRAQGVDGFVVEGWAALMAAASVPDEGVAKLEPILREALVSKPVVDRHKAVGARTVPTSSAELRRYLESETKRWGDVVRSRGIKLQ